MAIGDYNKTIWQNGGTPAINAGNLNNIENKLKELDSGVATREALTNFISDFFSSGVIWLNQDFLISYNGDMSVDVGQGVAYYFGNRIAYNPEIYSKVNIAPVTDGNTDYVIIYAVDNTNGDYTNGIYAVPDGYVGIYTYRSNNSNPNTPGVKLYRITVGTSTSEITSAEVTDLRQQIEFNY